MRDIRKLLKSFYKKARSRNARTVSTVNTWIFSFIVVTLLGPSVTAALQALKAVKDVDASKWSAVGSVAQAVATIVAAFFAWRAFQQTQATDRAEFRPYAEPLVIKFELKRNGIMCTTGVRNYGRTPARNLRLKYHIKLTVLSVRDDRELRPDVGSRWRELLHPSEAAFQFAPTWFGDMPPSNKNMAAADAMATVTLELTYEDEFGKEYSEKDKAVYTLKRTATETGLAFERSWESDT